MRRALGLALGVVLVAALGCSSSETKPSGGGSSTPPPQETPSTKDVTLTIKNEAPEARTVWIETYHPEGSKGDMSSQPDALVQLGQLAAGESVTKTFPVATRGWYRVVGARASEEHDRKVVFMGSFSRVKDSGEEPPVRVNR